MLRLETGATEQHSGTTGGAARNPLAELMGVVWILAISIYGFRNFVFPYFS
jgi:hypothetical protein